MLQSEQFIESLKEEHFCYGQHFVYNQGTNYGNLSIKWNVQKL